MWITVDSLEILLFTVSGVSFIMGYLLCYKSLKKEGLVNETVRIPGIEVLRKPKDPNRMRYVNYDY